MNLGKIGLILCCRIAAEPDAVAEVIAKRAGHDGIEVDNGDPFARFVVQHHVVEFRIVVRHAERDLPRCDLVHELTAEVFIDTGKDFRPEDSLTVPYTCSLGETVTLDFDLSVFEHSCGFRFDPLLEDSSMVRLEEIALTYEDGETKEIEFSRIKTNSDVDFEPIFVYLHKDPKFFVDEALSLKLKSARVRFQVLELGLAEK